MLRTFFSPKMLSASLSLSLSLSLCLCLCLSLSSSLNRVLTTPNLLLPNNAVRDIVNMLGNLIHLRRSSSMNRMLARCIHSIRQHTSAYVREAT
jgi:hypothetical protein